MSGTRISIRMDENLRKEAGAILEELGLNMSVTFNVFIKQLVRQGGPHLNSGSAVSIKKYLNCF